ncbi:MAG: hypothetical protein Q4A42_07020, partial [Tissierellia bacterium]|nr:hypothetical protein [Tissierellia bacterium]
MKKNRGVISIFISLILVPIMVLSMLTVDIAKLEYARSIVENSNELALQSVLSRFDSNLKNVYGLFASNNTIEDDITKLVTLSVNGASDKSDAVNLNNIAVKNVSIKAVENTSLQNQDVLKFQILEYMKFRGLVSLTYGFLNKLKGFEGKDKEIEATQERVKAEDAFGKYKEKLLDLYKKFEKLAEKENEYLNAEKGQLYKSIVGAKSPSEIEKVIENYLKDKYDIYFKKIPDFDREGEAKSAIPMGETQYTKSFPDLQKSLQKKDKKDKALQDLEDAKTRIRNLDYQYLNYHNNSVNAGSLKSYGKYPIDELIGLSTNLNPDSEHFLKNYSDFDDIIIGLTLKRSKKGNQYNEIWEDYVSIFRAVDGDSRAHADVKTEIRNSFPELSDKYSQKYFSNFMKKYYELYQNGTIDKKLQEELGKGYGEVKKALKAARDNIQKAIDTFSEIDDAIEEVKGAYEDAKAALEAWKAKAQQITDEEVKSQNMADIQLMENQLNEDYSLDKLKELMDLEKKYLEHIKKVLESVRLSGDETKFVSDGFKPNDFSKKLYKNKNYYDVTVEGEGKIEDLLKWLKEEVFKKLEALNKGDFKKEADKKEKDVLDDTDPEDSELEIPKLPEVGDMGVPVTPEGKPSDDGKKSALSALSNSIKFFANAGSLANLLENSANVLLLTEYGTEMFTNYLDREGADTENTKQKLLSGIEISKIASP